MLLIEGEPRHLDGLYLVALDVRRATTLLDFFCCSLNGRRPMWDVPVLYIIRSMAQTLSYDLASAEKAKDGKKMYLMWKYLMRR